MSSRPQFDPFPVITDGDMSTTLISLPTVINKLSMFSYDISWTGAPVGDFSVEVSNTYKQNADGTVRTVGNWTPLPLSGMPTATGTSGTGFIDIEAIGAYAMRLVFTPTSGSGTMNAVASGKVS